jgi:hypothetical protein
MKLHAPCPLYGELGLILILGILSISIFLSKSIDDKIIITLLDTSSSFLALALLPFPIIYFLPNGIKTATNYYFHSLVILGTFEFCTSILILPFVKRKSGGIR